MTKNTKKGNNGEVVNIYEKIGDVVRDDDAAKVICRCCKRRVDGRFECNVCGTEPFDVAALVFDRS